MTKKEKKNILIWERQDFLELKKDYKIVKVVQNLRNMLIKKSLFLSGEEREKYNLFDDNLREINAFFTEKIKQKQEELKNGKYQKCN